MFGWTKSKYVTSQNIGLHNSTVNVVHDAAFSAYVISICLTLYVMVSNMVVKKSEYLLGIIGLSWEPTHTHIV